MRLPKRTPIVLLYCLVGLLYGCASSGSATTGSGFFGGMFDGLGRLGVLVLCAVVGGLVGLLAGVEPLLGVAIGGASAGAHEAMSTPRTTTNNINSGSGDFNLTQDGGGLTNIGIIAICVAASWIVLRFRNVLFWRWPRIEATLDWFVRFILGRSASAAAVEKTAEVARMDPPLRPQ